MSAALPLESQPLLLGNSLLGVQCIGIVSAMFGRCTMSLSKLTFEITFLCHRTLVYFTLLHYSAFNPAARTGVYIYICICEYVYGVSVFSIYTKSGIHKQDLTEKQTQHPQAL